MSAAPRSDRLRLQAQGVCITRGRRRILEGVTLTGRAGELLALVGPNGAGKSTLLAVLAGDVRPDAGHVLLDGRPVQEMSLRDRADARAVLTQQHVMEFPFTGREVVAMGRPRPSRGIPDTDGPAVVDAALVAADAAHLADRAVPRMSVGEAARIAFARSLAQSTATLLLDEPTAALDIRHQEAVMRVARQLAAVGALVVAVLHDLNLAAAYADRVAVMHAGRLDACGSPGDVLTEERVERVFGLPVRVMRAPDTGRPVVMPHRGHITTGA